MRIYANMTFKHKLSRRWWIMKYFVVVLFLLYCICYLSLFLISRDVVEEEPEETRVCRKKSPKIPYRRLPLMYNDSCVGNKCIDSKKVRWTMVILIKSPPGNFVYRKVIRHTWATIGLVEGARFHYMFVIGKADPAVQKLLNEEHKRYADVLQIGVAETYRHIVYKTLAGMQWAVENLPEDYYYATADDDMVINLGAVQENIDGYVGQYDQQKWPEFPLICMHRRRVDWGPIRDVTSKYNVSFAEYKWPYYPDFCLGGMYATSVRLIRQLWEASRIEQPITMDDAWITGILREKIGMPWQMVYSVDPSAARHNYVFSVRTEETTKNSMEEDWIKVYGKFKHKVICVCEKS